MPRDVDDLSSSYGISPTEQDEFILKMFGDDGFSQRCMRHGLLPDLFAGTARQATVREIYRGLGAYTVQGQLTTDDLRRLLVRRQIPQELKDQINAYITELETNPQIKQSSNGYYYERLEQFIKERTVKRIQDVMITLPPEANPDATIQSLKEIVFEYDRAKAPKGINLRTEATFESLPPVVCRFGIPEIDRALSVGEDQGGIREGDLCTLLGYTGTGKSMTMIHLAKHALLRGRSVLYLSTELGRHPVITRFGQSFFGKDRYGINQDRHGLMHDKQWKAHFAKNSNLVLFGMDEWEISIPSIEPLWQSECERYGRKFDLLLIDTADELDPPDSSKSMVREYDRQGATYEWLRNFSEANGIATVVTTQANRRGGTQLWLDSKVMGDSHKKSQKAQIGISINGFPSEIKAGWLRMYLWKYTHGEADVKVMFNHRLDLSQLYVPGSSRYFNLAEHTKLLADIEQQQNPNGGAQ